MHHHQYFVGALVAPTLTPPPKAGFFRAADEDEESLADRPIWADQEAQVSLARNRPSRLPPPPPTPVPQRSLEVLMSTEPSPVRHFYAPSQQSDAAVSEIDVSPQRCHTVKRDDAAAASLRRGMSDAGHPYFASGYDRADRPRASEFTPVQLPPPPRPTPARHFHHLLQMAQLETFDDEHSPEGIDASVLSDQRAVLGNFDHPYNPAPLAKSGSPPAAATRSIAVHAHVDAMHNAAASHPYNRVMEAADDGRQLRKEPSPLRTPHSLPAHSFASPQPPMAQPSPQRHPFGGLDVVGHIAAEAPVDPSLLAALQPVARQVLTGRIPIAAAPPPASAVPQERLDKLLESVARTPAKSAIVFDATEKSEVKMARVTIPQGPQLHALVADTLDGLERRRRNSIADDEAVHLGTLCRVMLLRSELVRSVILAEPRARDTIRASEASSRRLIVSSLGLVRGLSERASQAAPKVAVWRGDPAITESPALEDFCPEVVAADRAALLNLYGPCPAVHDVLQTFVVERAPKTPPFSQKAEPVRAGEPLFVSPAPASARARVRHHRPDAHVHQVVQRVPSDRISVVFDDVVPTEEVFPLLVQTPPIGTPASKPLEPTGIKSSTAERVVVIGADVTWDDDLSPAAKSSSVLPGNSFHGGFEPLKVVRVGPATRTMPKQTRVGRVDGGVVIDSVRKLLHVAQSNESATVTDDGTFSRSGWNSEAPAAAEDSRGRRHTTRPLDAPVLVTTEDAAEDDHSSTLGSLTVEDQRSHRDGHIGGNERRLTPGSSRSGSTDSPSSTMSPASSTDTTTSDEDNDGGGISLPMGAERRLTAKPKGDRAATATDSSVSSDPDASPAVSPQLKSS